MRLTRRPAVVAAAAALIFAAAVVLFGAPARAAGDTPTLVVRAVDTTDPANSALTYLYTGSSGDVSGAQLTENGQQVEIASNQQLPENTPIDVALVFDVATPMDEDGALTSAKEAAKQWVQSRSAAQLTALRFGVYTTNSETPTIIGPSANTDRILRAIDQVGPASSEDQRKQSALWGAVKLAANDVGDAGNQADIVIMTGHGDTVGGDAAGARGAVESANAAVFVAEYSGAGIDDSALSSMVSHNGGELLKTDTGTEVGGLVDTISSNITTGQFVLQYSSQVDAGAVGNLTLTVGDQSDQVWSVTGSLTRGVPALHAQPSSSSVGISALQSNLGLLLGLLLAALAFGGIVYALVLVFTRENSLDAVLQPYAEPEAVDADVETDTSLARTQLMQRAVALTEQVAEERGLLSRAESALERANLPLRAGEALFFYAVMVVVLTVLGIVFFQSLLGGLALGLIAALAPPAVVSFIASRRRKAFMALLPDTLQLLSGTLRAGYSLMQGVEAVSQEVDEPMGQELRRVVTEARLGRPLEESLEGTAERMDSPDFAWAVMAIRIQREVGGNLAELLLTVAETMTARERLRRDVAALTAEGRVSAIVLGILPVGLALAMYVLNPDYISRLFDTTLGNILLITSVVSMLIGFFWMKKIIDIEI